MVAAQPGSEFILELNNRSDIDISSKLLIYSDNEGQLSLEDILQEHHQNNFQPLSSFIYDKPDGTAVYWLKLSVQRPDNRQSYQAWVFHFFSQIARFHSISYFEPEATGEFREVHTGSRSAYDSRDIKSNTYAFNLTVLNNNVKTVYLRIEDGSNLPLKTPTLRSRQRFNEYQQFTILFDTAFYSVVAAMFCYNFLLWGNLKERSQLLYLALILVMTTQFLVVDGRLAVLMGYDTIGPSAAVALVPAILQLLFVYTVLDIRRIIPSSQRVAWSIIAVDFCATIIFDVFHFHNKMFISAIFILIALTYIFSISLILIAVRRKRPLAIYLLVAETCWVTGYYIGLLIYAGAFESHSLLVFIPAKIGVLCELMLFSLILGRRASQAIYNLLEKERELVESQVEIIRISEYNQTLKDNFMSTISHELLTPINGIRLSLSLCNPELDKETKGLIASAKQSSQHLNNLVDSMITFMEARRGTLKLHKQAYDLKSSLHRIYRDFKVGVDGAIDVQMEWVDNTPKWIVSDEKKFSQIVVQLLSNAVTFTHKGDVMIRCEAEELESNTALLVITVKDSGTGISSSMQSHLFDAFSQADGSHSREQGGLGIGLANVKDIMALLKGSLSLDSIEGQGSVFSVRIPVTLVAEDEIERLENIAAAAAKKTTCSLSQESPSAEILVVEDNPVNMKLLLQVLIKLNYSTRAAVNGREALEALREHPNIAVILMDCQMPVMDGFEATRRIRLQSQHKSIPIIGVTANTTSEDRQHCRDAGMDDYLAKPVTMKMIDAVLHRWV